MTAPFLEVVLHTAAELFKQTGQVHSKVVGRFTAEEEEEISKTRNFSIVRLTRHFMLPSCEIIFTLVFWAVGIIKSYSFVAKEDSSMSKCLTNDLDLEIQLLDYFHSLR